MLSSSTQNGIEPGHGHDGGHGGHRESGGMINQIAMFTAIIATVGAIFGYMGGATQALSLIHI